MNLDAYIDKYRCDAIIRFNTPSTVVKEGCISRVVSRIYISSPSVVAVQNMRESLQGIAEKHCTVIAPKCSTCPVALFCNYCRNKKQHLEMKRVPFLDLFCGAGGLSLGFESAGLGSVYALDNNPIALATYGINHPFLKESQLECSDAEAKDFSKKLPEVPLVIGGPPCQGFSLANQQKSARDSLRNQLYKTFLQLAVKSKARVCLIENVPGMLKLREEIIAAFEGHGFLTQPVMLDASEFGFPQRRKRIFWLALKTKDLLLFQRLMTSFASHLQIAKERAIEHKFYLRDAISDLPSLKAKTVRNATNFEDETCGFTIGPIQTFRAPYSLLINRGLITSYLFNHKSKFNNPRDIAIYNAMRPGDKADSESVRHLIPYKTRNHIFKDKFYRLRWGSISKTITAHMYYDCHMYVHPEQARGLTPREAARIQGFPDNYLFLGQPNEWYRQIGNAVSPLVAYEVAKATLGALKDCKIHLTR